MPDWRETPDSYYEDLARRNHPIFGETDEEIRAHFADAEREAERQSALFDGLETYCMFIGYPYSGHSLVGSLLDAHESMAISHELHALKFLDNLQNCIERAEAVRSWREFEQWDAAFHEALAEATQNRAVIDMLKSINALRDHAAWGVLKKKSLTAARRKIYERQHRAILMALTKRESERAQKAIRHHLLAVRKNLLGY